MLKKVLKIKLKVVTSIIAILILAQVITAYFFGVIAEKQLNLQFKHMTDSSMITVVKHDYHRGWFSSSENVTLAVNSQFLKNIADLLPASAKESAPSVNKADYVINYSTNITNGLFAGWLHGKIYPTIAYADTTVALPEKLDKMLNKFFDGKPAIKINNVIFLNKAGKYIITSPLFDYDETLSGVKVNWGGLDLEIAYNDKFNQFENNLEVPSFAMIAPTKGEFGFNGLNYNSVSSYSVNQIKVGTTDFNLRNLKVQLVESNITQFKLGEAVHLLTGVNSVDFLNGIDAINPTNFTISNVHYNSLSNDQNNLFNATAKAGFESLTSNSNSYGPMNFDLDIGHIDAPAFSKLADLLNSAAAEDQSTTANRDKTITQLKATMLPILINSPLITLNEFKLKTPSGMISIAGNATTHNFESRDMADQSKFMQKLSLKMDFSLPKPILAYFFVLQMKYFLTSGNAQMDKQSSDALVKVVNILLDNQLSVWLKKGYLKESGNELSSKIAMESGVVTLNGVVTK